MEHEANQLQAFTNYTVVIEFLLSNYLTFLTNKNQTPSLSMMKFPFQDLSTGVITVMILTILLSVVWTVCVTYLIVQVISHRRQRKADNSGGKLNDAYSDKKRSIEVALLAA